MESAYSKVTEIKIFKNIYFKQMLFVLFNFLSIQIIPQK